MCSDARLQLRKPLSPGEIANTLGSIGARADVPGSDKLDPLQDVADYFTEAPIRKMVHLVIRFPPSGEYPCTIAPYLISSVTSLAALHPHPATAYLLGSLLAQSIPPPPCEANSFHFGTFYRG